MELRKDPITRSWVITGDDVIEPTPRTQACRFCGPSAEPAHVIANLPGVDGSAWSARSVVHPHALYHIEGEAARRADGLYDRMGSVGAHEVLIENPRHDGHLWDASDFEVEQFLRLAAQRIQDLKRDSRFKYVSIFKDHGEEAGQEFEHPTSQLTATTFVPRRVLYELRAGRDYFESKERCVFCDILAQEERQNLRIVETRGDYVAFCPYARRAPCYVSAPSPQPSTSCSTPRPTASILRKHSDFGKHSMTITTGTSRFCRSLRLRPGHTRSRRFIILPSPPRQRSSVCARQRSSRYELRAASFEPAIRVRS
jgi:galactose-1-phosphate uridylyltransferase